MNRLPRITGVQLVSALRKAGFEIVRTRGSHHFLRDGAGRCTVVPVHRGELLGVGLLSEILRDCEMEPARLEALLKH